MGYNPHTVSFLSRATRLTAVICAICWLAATGIAFFGSSNLASRTSVDVINAFFAPIVLYLVPAVVLFALASQAKEGHMWANATILAVCILSLFKLVLLVTDLTGPYFNPPLSCELPARIACALLSVACIYAWEDVADMNRTRSHATAREIPIAPAAKVNPPPRRKPQTPPPVTSIPRQKTRREDPPPSHTPWS
jgi:hypothetical protein